MRVNPKHSYKLSRLLLEKIINPNIYLRFFGNGTGLNKKSDLLNLIYSRIFWISTK